MNTRLLDFLYIWLMILSIPAAHAQGIAAQNIEFELSDSQGKRFALRSLDTPVVVLAFLGTECPLAKLYAVRLNQIANRYANRVTIWAISSNQQDSPEELTRFSRQFNLDYPFLKDPRAELADQLTATRTPEVVVLDHARNIRYRGRIDDQYGVGYARGKPTRNDLEIAIQELLEGRDVSVPETTAVGCIIGRPSSKKPEGAITYTQHIARILNQHCVECHREGQIAPFALTDYDEVIGWADTIREVIELKRMPPWHAAPEHGQFVNTRAMPASDKEKLFQWINNGMPYGDATELPAVPEAIQGWSLDREPDLVVQMSTSPFEVPAEGTVEYQYFVAETIFKEDKWVRAAEVVPGNREVVHHAIVFVRPPGGERQDGIGWLTAFVPGQTLTALPEGTARKIPRGSKLVFQMHYTPVGRVTQDLTKVGLVFADEESIHTELQTKLAINRDFEIPPGDDDFRVQMTANRFAPGSKLWAIAPHMHYRGKSFRVAVESPGGREIILDVPNYDFNWQHAYVLQQPLALDEVTLQCTATFDNSPKNLSNPDPTARVSWGDQTWEEMAMAYLAVLVPRVKQSAKQRPSTIIERQGKPLLTIAEREVQADRIAKQYFARLDANEDGIIQRGETPKSFRAFAWRVFDTNQDDQLSWEEILQQARLSLRP